MRFISEEAQWKIAGSPLLSEVPWRRLGWNNNSLINTSQILFIDCCCSLFLIG
jgi:hypothetical protein